MESPKIQRALLSVSDKEGLIDFAQGLHDAGVELYSTGGTSRHLQDAGIPVRDVSDYTNFPEMMDGRVKTLHPKIFAGILCRHDRPDDMNALEEHEIATFELVVVNLYPFQQTRPWQSLMLSAEKPSRKSTSAVQAWSVQRLKIMPSPRSRLQRANTRRF